MSFCGKKMAKAGHSSDMFVNITCLDWDEFGAERIVEVMPTKISRMSMN